MAAFGPGATVTDTVSFLNLALVLLGVLYYVVLQPWRRRDAPAALAEELLSAEGGARRPVAERLATAHSAYLDNLKVFLTASVVVYHVVCTFSTGSAFGYNVSISRGVQLPSYLGYSVDNSFASVFAPWFIVTNQSYFMCLFFLISGLFTPSSFDRKGREEFLKDKFQRLGVPLLGYYFVFGPAMAYLEALTFGGEDEAKLWFDGSYKNKWFTSGPPWFLLWLLNFNVVYAFTDGAPLLLAAPSSALVFAAAFFVGLLQYVVPPTDFMQVPMGLNQLVAGMLFFCVGVLARRGAWLEALSQLEPGTVWFVRFWALLLSGVFFIEAVDLRPSFVQSGNIYGMLAAPGPFFMGCASVVMCYAQLQFFQAHLGGSRSIVKWASSAAYTVYLIHPPFVVFGAYLYVQILQACGMEVTVAPSQGWIIHTGRVEYMWLGFAFNSFVVCGLVLWPVAWVLAQMPGLPWLGLEPGCPTVRLAL